jgi:hypothetical protein
MAELLETRWREFEVATAEDRGDWVAFVLGSLGEALSKAVDPEGAKTVLEMLYTRAGLDLTGFSKISGWISPEDFSVEQMQKIPLYRRYLALRAYAEFGLPAPYRLDWSKPDDKSVWFEGAFWPVARGSGQRLIQMAEIINDIETIEYIFGSGDERVPQLLDISNTRYEIDLAQGLGDLDLNMGAGFVGREGLAGLAGVTIKSLRNDLAPSSTSEIHIDEEGNIPVSLAIDWLKDRRKYRPSVWHLDPTPKGADSSRDDVPKELDSVVFVPMAKDGDYYRPDLECEGEFRIGSAESEQIFTTYEQALDALCRMPEPCWRRPDTMGRWRTIRGVSWQRRTLSELI